MWMEFPCSVMRENLSYGAKRRSGWMLNARMKKSEI
jgi:hypothetical protein